MQHCALAVDDTRPNASAVRRSDSSFSGGLRVQEYITTDVPETPFDRVLAVEYIRGSDYGGGIGGLLYSIRQLKETTATTGAVFDEPMYRYNHYDARGDIIGQADETQALTWQASYEAFGTHGRDTTGRDNKDHPGGESWGENLDRQRANTKYEDFTGLLNEGFRYRDLDAGVFLQRDPLGMVDGPNLYSYVKQNPWTKFDPTGLTAVHAARLGGRFILRPAVIYAGNRIMAGILASTMSITYEEALNSMQGETTLPSNVNMDAMPQDKNAGTVVNEPTVDDVPMHTGNPVPGAVNPQEGLTIPNVPDVQEGFDAMPPEQAAEILNNQNNEQSAEWTPGMDLPGLDDTGKVHGGDQNVPLPKPKDLGRIGNEDLEILRGDLESSIQERIRKNVEHGSDKAHAQRQAQEQDLVKSIDKELESRSEPKETQKPKSKPKD